MALDFQKKKKIMSKSDIRKWSGQILSKLFCLKRCLQNWNKRWRWVQVLEIVFRSQTIDTYFQIKSWEHLKTKLICMLRHLIRFNCVPMSFPESNVLFYPAYKWTYNLKFLHLSLSGWILINVNCPYQNKYIKNNHLNLFRKKLFLPFFVWFFV